MKIHALNVSNYRSLGEDVRVEFPHDGAGLIVLAGINGAGKSNVLDAFAFVGDVVRGGVDAALAHRGGERALVREGQRAFEVAVELDDDASRYVWGMGVSLGDTLMGRGWEWGYAVPRRAVAAHDEAVAGGRAAWRSGARGPGLHEAYFGTSSERERAWEIGNLSGPMSGELAARARSDPGWRGVQDHLAGWRVYTLPYEALREVRPGSSGRAMASDGTNWASVLASLDPTREGLELRAALCRLVPDLVDYRVTDVGGLAVAQFQHRGDGERDGWRAAEFESDGTLRAAAILTATLQRPLPTLLGVEEPETAIHVRALGVIVDFLLDAAGRSQVVLTTQSPDLLDLVPPESVRVAARGERGTAVRAIDPVQRAVLRDQSAGALLREQGLFGDETLDG